jgi:L-threonylcarbamoyladenylate synthase
VNAEDVARLEQTIAAGGLALLPTDTVYGLATDPDNVEGIHRLYWIKGRNPDMPSAVMFFDLKRALEAMPELGDRTCKALNRLLPGPVTVIVPNDATHFPLACGADPGKLGLRVPELTGDLDALKAMARPVLQSSANPSGNAGDPKRLEDVDARIRRGVDIELDAGELPGKPSTVVDLSGYEKSGEYDVLREGAMSAERIAAALTAD